MAIPLSNLMQGFSPGGNDFETQMMLRHFAINESKQFAEAAAAMGMEPPPEPPGPQLPPVGSLAQGRSTTPPGAIPLPPNQLAPPAGATPLASTVGLSGLESPLDMLKREAAATAAGATPEPPDKGKAFLDTLAGLKVPDAPEVMPPPGAMPVQGGGNLDTQSLQMLMQLLMGGGAPPPTPTLGQLVAGR